MGNMSDGQGVRVVRYQTGKMVMMSNGQYVRLAGCQSGKTSDWQDVRWS